MPKGIRDNGHAPLGVWPRVTGLRPVRRVGRVGALCSDDELALAHADGSYPRLLATIAKADVLILDDWGLAPVGPRERRDLNEIMDDRYGSRSTINTSQFPTETWHDQLGDPTTADAICDRILSNAHRVKLAGPSRRKQESNLAE